MRLSLPFVSILITLAACGDDGGSGSDDTDTSAGPSTDDSSSAGSQESGSSGGSSGDASADSGSTSGADTGETGETGDTGATGESGGSSETGDPTGGGAFACGDDLECDLATQYCQEQVSDIGGEPNTYQCIALPDACAGVNSCDCLGDEPCGMFDLCEMTPEGGSILSCPGG